MDAKQKQKLQIAGGVFGVVFLVLGYFLFTMMQEMNAAEETRDQNRNALNSAYTENGRQDKKTGEWTGEYPNAANLKVRKADTVAYTTVADDAAGLFTYELDYPHGETPPQFAIRLGNTVSALNARQQVLGAPSAAKRDATQETACHYAFDRYIVQKELPTEANVPRLAKQLAVIEYVSKLLLDNGAVAITAVTRQEFDKVKQEEPKQTTRRRGSRATPEKQETGVTVVDAVLQKDGMTCESYSITFRARYNTVAAVLNTLSSDKLFVVVTDVSMKSPADLLKRQASLIETKLSAKKKAASARREETTVSETETKDLFKDTAPVDRLLTDPVVCEPLIVTIKFDVYSMPPTEADGVASEAKGN